VANGERLIGIEIQRAVDAIERCRRDAYECDGVQAQRMSEAQSTIEMLRAEVDASNQRSQNGREEADQTRRRLGQLQQELLKAEERWRVLTEQLLYCEEQKKLMKLEVGMADRSPWNTKKVKLLQTE
jgi:chromosome segregation ATPase